MSEFFTPTYPEDLEVEQVGNRFYVKDVADLESPDVDASALLGEAGDALAEAEVLTVAILDNAVFDKLYSLIKYWSILTPAVQAKLIELMAGACNDLVEEVQSPASVAAALQQELGPGAGAAGGPREAQRLMATLRNGFKAMVYLFSVAVQVAEKTYQPAGAGVLGAAAKKSTSRGKKGGKTAAKGAKKGKKAAADDYDDDEEPAADNGDGGDADNASEESFDWPHFRADCVSILVKAMSGVDFRSLWAMGMAEEEFLAAVLKTSTRMLLSQQAMTKDKAARPLAVLLFCATVVRCPTMVSSSASSLVAGIMGNDHFPEVAADCIAVWSTGVPAAAYASTNAGAAGANAAPSALYSCQPAAAEVLRELGRIQSSAASADGQGAAPAASSSAAAAMAKDTAGLRRAATFLALASERLPHVVLSNVSVLLPYLDCDSATLRSALVTSVGKILIRAHAAQKEVAAAVTSAQQHQQQQGGGSADAGNAGALSVAVSGLPKATVDMARLMTQRTRDTLLDLLSDRCYDVHAAVRGTVLRAWALLVVTGVIPLDRFQRVTDLAVERLRDKGAVVRKAAASLLRSLLEHNPFGASVDVALFERQREAAEMWLASRAPHLLPGAERPQAPAAAPEPTADKKQDEAASSSDNADADEEDSSSAAVTASLPKPPSAEEATYMRARSGAASAGNFARSMESSVPVMAELMASKTGSDVREAIRFLAKARSFRLQGAEAALARMLTLVWSQSPGVKEEVIATFDTLYIRQETLAEEEDDDSDEQAHADEGDAAAGAAADKQQPAEASQEKAAEAEAPRPKRAAAKTAASKSKKAKAGHDDDDESEDDDDSDADEDEDEDDDDDDDAPKKGAAKKKPAAKAPVKKAAASKKAPARGKSGAAAAAADDSKPAVASSGKAAVLPSFLKPSEIAAREEAIDAEAVAEGLAALLRGASLAVRASLQEVLKELLVRGMVPASLYSALWSKVKAGLKAHFKVRVATNAVLQAVVGSSSSSSSPAAVPSSALKVGSDRIRAASSSYEQVVATARSAMDILSMLAAAAVANPAAGAAPAAAQVDKDRLAAVTSAFSLSSGGVKGGGVKALRKIVQVLMAGQPSQLTSDDEDDDEDEGDNNGSSFSSLAAAASSVPIGSELLAKAAPLLLAEQQSTSLSTSQLAAALSHSLSTVDYRLAAHACHALAKMKGEGLIPARKQMQNTTNTAAAAPVAAPAAAASKKGAKPSSSSHAAEESEASQYHSLLNQCLAGIAGIVSGTCEGPSSSTALENVHWYTAAQAGIDAIFALAPYPDVLCARILARMANSMTLGAKDAPASSADGWLEVVNEAASSSSAPVTSSSSSSLSLSIPALSRFVFVLGHVGLRTLCHLDALALRVKTLRIAAAEKAEKDRAAAASTAAAKSKAGAGKGAAAGGLEEQLGANAAEDEQEAELLASIIDREMAAASVLSTHLPLLRALVNRYLLGPVLPSAAASSSSLPQAAPHRLVALGRSALLAMAKLMAVSVDVCEGGGSNTANAAAGSNLQLLFTVMERSTVPSVRSTAATAIGDLTFRFPNSVEPYSHYLYARLRDPVVGVRKNALLVLTHLVLNGMVKLKGQVGGIAVCLVDQEPRIAAAAKSFLVELSKRGGSPIYNILPDALSHLTTLVAECETANEKAAGSDAASSSSSAPAAPAATSTTGSGGPLLRPFTSSDLQTVLKFLLSFIDKDKQAEGLTDKLVHRLEATTSKHVWRGAATCLSLLPTSEKITRKLAESLNAYKKTLVDDIVFDAFVGMINKAKKVVPAATTSTTAAAAASKAAAAEGEDGGNDENAPGKSKKDSAASKAELREVVANWERLVMEARTGVVDETEADARARNVARRAAALAAAEGKGAASFDAEAAALKKKAEEAAAAELAAAAAATAGPGAKGKTKIKVGIIGAGKPPAGAAATASAPAPAAASNLPVPGAPVAGRASIIVKVKPKAAPGSAAAPAPAGPAAASKAIASAAAAAPARKKKGIIDSDEEESDSSSDDDDDFDQEEDSEEEEKKKAAKAKPAAKKIVVSVRPSIGPGAAKK